MTITRVNPAGWTNAVDNITPAQANQLDVNATLAVDGVGGGAYAPTSPISIGGSGIKVEGPLIMSGTAAVKQYRYVLTTDLPDGRTFGPTQDIIEFPQPIALRTHELVAAGTTGRTITFKRTSAGNFNILIQRTIAGGVTVVTLTANQYATATVFDDGTNWRLLHFSPQAVPGAGA